MDIVAESLSAKILKSREVLVNGQDIMDYIRSKLSTAVEFSGVYDDIDNIPLSAQFNGSIVIVDSKEYIYSDKSEPNHWQEIGDETAVRQLATDLAAVSGEVSAIFDDISYIKSISANYKTYADTTTQLSSDGYALTADIPTYSDISSNIHLSDYALTNNVSTAIELEQQFNGAKAYIDFVKSYADNISSKVDNLSNDLIYATVSTDTSLEGLTASTGDAGTRKLVFKPSYFGMNSSDELKSIVLQTRSNSSGYGITSAYIRVRKYNGLGDGGEIIGTSKCFNWPTQNSKNIQIDFDQVIQFNSPIEQYYFECLSADASSNLGIVKVLGMAMRVLNSADPKLPQISGNYFVTGIYNGNETIFSQLRPPLSVNYRHAYSMADLSAQVDEKYDQLVGQNTDLSSADTIYGAKAYASDLVNSLDATDTPTTGKFVVAVSQENGVISVQKASLTIPEGLSSYAATVANLSNDGYALTSTTSQVANELSNAISSKVYVGNLQTGEHTDLSVLKVTANEYEQLVADANSSGVDLSNNVIYIVSSDSMNMYGEKILNLTMEEDNEPSEATNKHYVDSQISDLSDKIDDLSTYEQTKSQLIVDGFAQTSSIPSYNDISTNIHLSDYALSNDVSSKVDLEAAFNEKLDAVAGAKAFSELSTYSLYEHVSYNGLIWECISAITAPGQWNENNWRITDMTSPDATLDVTADDRLRVVSADGSIIWQQGYNITQEQYSAITANIDALSSLVTAANNSLETILNESL